LRCLNVHMDSDDKIGIAGGGVEGLALAEYLAGKGYGDVTVFDEREDFGKTEAGASAGSVPDGVKVVAGAGAFGKMADCVVIFRSPGIRPDKLEKALGIAVGTGMQTYAGEGTGDAGKSARADNSRAPKITSTTQYFLENCPCRVIGVTGTKGKGTTSTLIYLMLKEAGFDAYLGGNIGESPLTFLDKLTADSVVVLELSSFQLQDLTISPSVAVVLRTTSEHLDYHKDTTEYRAAKLPIVRFQKATDAVILNKDYEYWKEYAEAGPAKKFFVSLAAEGEEISSKSEASAFGVDGAQGGSDDGAAAFSGDGAHLSGPMIVNCAGVKCEMIGRSDKVALKGRFNLENILPAVAAARIFEVPIPAIQKVIYSFAGLPHRLEFVREVNGVKYYNDSFSTTPETSIAAVYAFNAPVLLIAGGSEKNSDYSEWGIELQKNHNLKMIFLMGVTAPRMERALKEGAQKLKGMDIMGEFPLKIRHSATLEDAVLMAAKLALPGDNIVMSPAAASFDQFKNYKYRGEAFREIVGKL